LHSTVVVATVNARNRIITKKTTKNKNNMYLSNTAKSSSTKKRKLEFFPSNIPTNSLLDSKYRFNLPYHLISPSEEQGTAKICINGVFFLSIISKDLIYFKKSFFSAHSIVIESQTSQNHILEV